MLGLVLLAVCVACVIALFWPGPADVAEAMGVSCGDRSGDPSHQCSAFDATSVLWTTIWVTFVAGVVLRLATRPKGKGPLVLNLRRR